MGVADSPSVAKNVSLLFSLLLFLLLKKAVTRYHSLSDLTGECDACSRRAVSGSDHSPPALFPSASAIRGPLGIKHGDNLEQFIQRLLYGRPTSTSTASSQDTTMPWLSERTRRPSRHSSTPQKPLTHAPPVLRSTSPVQVKKSSNASKAQLRPPKRQEATSIPKSTAKSNPTPDTATKRSSTRDVDVFDFMDNTTEEEDDHQHTGDEHEDDDDAIHGTGGNTAASSPVSAHHPAPRYSDLEVNADQQSKRQTWHGAFNQAGSFHSDSGISMGSSSGDADSPVLHHKYPSMRRPSTHEPSIPEDNGLNVSCAPLPIPGPAFAADVWPQLSATPEAYYTRLPREAPKSLDDTTFHLPVTPPELSPQLPRGRKQHAAKEPSATKHGYSQLASRISSQEDAVLKPVYRKFETLNNRILLYLQDEISELEADLEELDAAITREAQCMGRDGYAASRRAEAKAPSQLQWHRNNLTERCASKVDTYSESCLHPRSRQRTQPWAVETLMELTSCPQIEPSHPTPTSYKPYPRPPNPTSTPTESGS